MAIWDDVGGMLGIRSPEEQQYSDQLKNLALGKGPSAAQNQLNQGLATAQHNNMAIAGSDRTNPALAMRNAMLSNAQAGAQANQVGAMARSNEQLGALNQLGQYAQQKNATNAKTMGAVLGGVASGMTGAGLGTGAIGSAMGAAMPGGGQPMQQPQASPVVGQQAALGGGYQPLGGNNPFDTAMPARNDMQANQGMPDWMRQLLGGGQ